MIFIERLEKRRNGGEPSEGLLVFPICIGQANFMHALTDSHVGTCSRRSSGSRNRALADRYGNDMTPSDAAASRSLGRLQKLLQKSCKPRRKSCMVRNPRARGTELERPTHVLAPRTRRSCRVRVEEAVTALRANAKKVSPSAMRCLDLEAITVATSGRGWSRAAETRISCTPARASS